MKLIQTIKGKLPVSRKTHDKALARERQDHDTDVSWLQEQLRQATARNIRLENALFPSEE